jgi:expansin
MLEKRYFALLFRAGRLGLLPFIAVLLWVGVRPWSTAVSAPLALNATSQIYLPLVINGSLTPEAPPVDEPIAFGDPRRGEGTYYDADGGGNCLFPPSPDNMMVAAMNHADYNDAAVCGAFARVTGPNGAIMVRIVDQCPECAPGDIDLSYEAFALIANPLHGRVPISWRYVSPPLPGPIRYQFKDGSNQWWTAVQVRNHRNPIARFEYQTAGGAFVELPRTAYNYFVKTDGMGPGPYTFRVTDIFGRTVTDSNIPHIENGSVAGSAQFPPP